jgi:hypothetical protein
VFYINYWDGRSRETADEFETRKEARAMLIEYHLVSLNYYLSTRCCAHWREK